VSEVYQASETTPPASEAGATAPYDAGSGPASADNAGSYPDAAPGDDFAGYSDADIDAILAAEDQLPEPRTRQEAAAATWDDNPDDPADDELAAEYDGDVAALLAAEDQLPEPRTRQEAATATWDDTTQPGDDPGSFAGDPASEYDGDVAALLAAEDQLPEPRTRQEAAAAAWADTSTSQDGAPDTSTDSTGPSQPDTVTEPPARNNEGEDGTPGPTEGQFAGHAQDGTDVTVTVAYLPPEARTVGDTTPTGIGRKPTGAEILDMEGDKRTESRLDRLFDEMVKGADDISDGSGAVGEAIVIDDRPAPGPSGHSRPYHAATNTAPDHPAPPNPGANDAISSMTIIGVAAAVALRHALSALRKEHKA